MYKLTSSGRIKRISDGAVISNDPGHPDQAEYQAWVALGNTPEAADPPPIPTYRQRRARAYSGANTYEGLGKEVGVIVTIGDVIDTIISELVARGTASTADFQTLLDRRAAIKAAYPPN